MTAVLANTADQLAEMPSDGCRVADVFQPYNRERAGDATANSVLQGQ
jgi:hypothetical protein